MKAHEMYFNPKSENNPDPTNPADQEGVEPLGRGGDVPRWNRPRAEQEPEDQTRIDVFKKRAEELAGDPAALRASIAENFWYVAGEYHGGLPMQREYLSAIQETSFGTPEAAEQLATSNRFDEQIFGLHLMRALCENGDATEEDRTRVLEKYNERFIEIYSAGIDSFYTGGETNDWGEFLDPYDTARLDSDNSWPHLEGYDTILLRALGELATAAGTSGNDRSGPYYLEIVKKYITITDLRSKECRNGGQAEKIGNKLFWPGDAHGESEYFCADRARLTISWDQFVSELGSEQLRIDPGYGGGQSDIEFDEDVKPYYAMLGTLKKIKHPKSTDLAIALLKHDPRRIANTVGLVLSEIDPHAGANQLLPLLKSTDFEVADAAARAIYRLEFGNIGVSAEGVEYLNKRYDLGEYNKPQHTVRKLTGDGRMGIFDEQRRLFKQFQLTELTSEEEVVRAQVLDFTYESLYTPQSNETRAQRVEREKYLREFLENYFDFYDDEFSQATGVRINNLSLKEQGQVLLFYKQADPATRQEVLDFVKRYGENGFRAFLSLEFGSEMGNIILELGKKFQQKNPGCDITAWDIFRKYAEISQAAETVTTHVTERYQLDESAHTDSIINEATERLLRRAKDLLVEMSNAETTGARGNAIFRQLQRINSDNLLFQQVFRAAFREADHRGHPLELNDVIGLSLDSHSSAGLTAEDQQTMQRIYVENRAESQEYSPELLLELTKELEVAFRNEHATWFTLRKDGEIIAYNRIEERPELGAKHVYAGSFNVRKDYQGSAVGQAHARATRERFLSQGYTLHGTATLKNFAYWQTMGAMEDGPDPNHPGFVRTITTPESWARAKGMELELKLAA